jgi:hypothetical protein
MLPINNLQATVGDKPILAGFKLTVAATLLVGSMPVGAEQQIPLLDKWQHCVSFQEQFLLEQYQFRRSVRMAKQSAKDILKLCAPKFPNSANRSQRRSEEKSAFERLSNHIFIASQQAKDDQGLAK